MKVPSGSGQARERYGRPVSAAILPRCCGNVPILSYLMFCPPIQWNTPTSFRSLSKAAMRWIANSGK